MLADFLEPFWEALFEKTGVFGIFLAAAAPVILIIVLILIIFAFYSLFKVAKKKRLEKMYHEARYLEYRERYDEAWELYKKYVKKTKPSAEVCYHIGLLCASAIAKDCEWGAHEKDANPSYWFNIAKAMGYSDAETPILKIKFSENFPSDLLECAKITKSVKELCKKQIPEANELYEEIKKEIEENVSAKVITYAEGEAVLGDSKAQIVVAKDRLQQRKDKEGLGWIAFSAENKNADAQFMMADFYRNGSWDNLIKKDSKKAFEFYEKAAENGISKAKIALGEMYYQGEGCQKDLLKAAASFAKVVTDEKDPDAAHNAAVCYYQYANECAVKKGLKTPEDKKRDNEYMRYMLYYESYEHMAKEYGYKG